MTASALREQAAAIAENAPLVTTGLARLRESFLPEQIGKLPKAGITLDYVGHGAVTHRLLEVDPLWTWEPFAVDADGLPKFTVDNQGNPIALWIRLTVLGVTRPGCGTCGPKQFDAEKVLIGDALRNAAMRFGVALDLWIRGQAEDDEQVSNTGTAPTPDRTTEGVTIKDVKVALVEACGGDAELAGDIFKASRFASLAGWKVISPKDADELLELAPAEYGDPDIATADGQGQ